MSDTVSWVHYSYSSAPIIMEDREQDGATIYGKPNGLWITPYSSDDSWFNWCIDAQMRVNHLNFIHDVKIANNANLLQLNSADDLDKFTDEYGYNGLEEIMPQAWAALRLEKRDRHSIQWEQVAEKYDGILIPTYIGSRRLEFKTAWYYPWDCASGCIWNAKAVESVTLRSSISAGYESSDFLSLDRI